jgi:hypothetical protein
MSREFVNDFAKGKCHFMQLWKQALHFFGRKCREQAISQSLIFWQIQRALVLLFQLNSSKAE